MDKIAELRDIALNGPKDKRALKNHMGDCMSGKEWFHRFMTAYKASSTYLYGSDATEQAVKAAKIASGHVQNVTVGIK